MKIVIFGLTISSAWGNGHATLWRGLCRALHARGHDITFFERDEPYYARNRDLVGDSCRLVLYDDWTEAMVAAGRELAHADAAIVTSYCPDGPSASEVVLQSRVTRKVFYDLDSPVTLDRLAHGERVSYLPPQGLGGFDLVLSYAGGGRARRVEGPTGCPGGGAALRQCRPGRPQARGGERGAQKRPLVLGHVRR